MYIVGISGSDQGGEKGPAAGGGAGALFSVIKKKGKYITTTSKKKAALSRDLERGLRVSASLGEVYFT